MASLVRIAPTLALFTAGILAGCAPDAPTPAPSAGCPNVLLVLADDLGFADLATPLATGGQGSDFYQTPAIDRLAARSTAFHQVWAAPNCAPGRAALLTGEDGDRTGVFTNDESDRGEEGPGVLEPPPNADALAPEFSTMADDFAAAGYRTGAFGKWHLGTDGEGTGPLDHGFADNVGGTANGIVTGGSDGHFAQADGSFEDLPGLGPNGVPYEFSTDRLVDEALAWLTSAPEAPAFLYFAPFAVHQPVQSPDDALAIFADAPPGVRHSNPVYAGMLYDLDAGVGRLLDALAETDDPRSPGSTLADDTIVVFTSDNGGVGGYAALGVDQEDVTSNLPLSGGKGMLYEGGLRVPLLLAGPGIPAGLGLDTPVSLLDLRPTLDALAGIDAAVDGDGESVVPLLSGGELARTVLVHHFPAYLEADDGTFRARPTTVARDDRYKLWFEWEDRSFSLYDLAADPGELDDVADEHADVVASLAAAMRDWLIETAAPLPRDPATGVEEPLPSL